MTESAKPLLHIRKLVKTYDLLPVLKNLDLDVSHGQYVALLGSNGSGKSTFLKLLTGLTKPTSGTIQIGGWNIPEEAHAVRSSIGVVSHKPLLYENLSAEENLTFFAQLYNLEASVASDRINELLDQVGLGKRSHDLVRSFSRGMQQRLSIARALLHQPDVLLLDEPYTGLDQDAARTLDGILLQAKDAGHTLIMTTHQIHRLDQLADRVLILAGGQIKYDELADETVMRELFDTYTQVTGMATIR